jgi:2-polyprenyl-3-methyl-5-hydroxy-6-metoxy-1,4-benzoquinol methylase
MIDKPQCICCMSSLRTIGLKGEYDVLECEKCGYLTFRPLPTLNELRKFYSYEYFVKNDNTSGPGYANILSEGFKQGTIAISNVRMGIIANIRKNKNKGFLLDMGCAQGLFLGIANTLGWYADGVEINQEMREMASRAAHGINIYTSIDEISRSYDVITLWEYFEHLPDPVQELCKIKKLFNPNGLLCLSFPNSESRYGSRDRVRWEQVKPPEHLHLWNAKSIRMLLEHYGFRVVCFRYFGLRLLLDMPDVFGSRSDPKTIFWPVASFLARVLSPLFSVRHARLNFGSIVRRSYAGMEVYAVHDENMKRD